MRGVLEVIEEAAEIGGGSGDGDFVFCESALRSGFAQDSATYPTQTRSTSSGTVNQHRPLRKSKRAYLCLIDILRLDPI